MTVWLYPHTTPWERYTLLEHQIKIFDVNVRNNVSVPLQRKEVGCSLFHRGDSWLIRTLFLWRSLIFTVCILMLINYNLYCMVYENLRISHAYRKVLQGHPRRASSHPQVPTMTTTTLTVDTFILKTIVEVFLLLMCSEVYKFTFWT